MNAMRVLCFGSMNIDYTYYVDRFVTEGATILASRMATFCGGKGLNQSIALRRGGAEVWHAGVAGTGSEILLDALRNEGVHLEYLQVTEREPNGQAIIQVDGAGRNCIIVYPGSNVLVTRDYVDEVLDHFHSGDCIVLQNEISNLEYIIRSAAKKEITIFLNPSPITEELQFDLLQYVDYLILNEVEGKALTGQTEFQEILDVLQERCPKTKIVLTIGEQGVLYRDQNGTLSHGIFCVPVADTTAAGDTFSGFFIASISRGLAPWDALHYASMASAICVSRKGAAPSIPRLEEVLAFEKTLPKTPDDP